MLHLIRDGAHDGPMQPEGRTAHTPHNVGIHTHWRSDRTLLSETTKRCGELYLDTVRPWESAVEASHRPDMHIELSDLGIGAKDSSNLLVAGFLRNFLQVTLS